MMMDRAGAEMLQHRHHQDRENQRHARRRFAGEFAREPHGPGEEDEQQRRRPNHHGNPLGNAGRQPDRRGFDY